MDNHNCGKYYVYMYVTTYMREWFKKMIMWHEKLQYTVSFYRKLFKLYFLSSKHIQITEAP